MVSVVLVLVLLVVVVSHHLQTHTHTPPSCKEEVDPQPPVGQQAQCGV
jgi:hypothetical protein